MIPKFKFIFTIYNHSVRNVLVTLPDPLVIVPWWPVIVDTTGGNAMKNCAMMKSLCGDASPISEGRWVR